MKSPSNYTSLHYDLVNITLIIMLVEKFVKSKFKVENITGTNLNLRKKQFTSLYFHKQIS